MRRILNRTLNSFAAIASRIVGLGSASVWSSRIAKTASQMAYSISDDMKYKYVASSPLLLWRAKTLFDKEPETISWIRNFDQGDVLYDIGANVGMYSIYAGMRGAKVYSFEPESANFSVLNQNICLNGIGNRVIAYPLALSDEERLDTLRLSAVEPGAALHAFGTNVDFRGLSFSPKFAQGSICTTLDALVERWGLECPTHLKIDVDGLEPNIVRGGERLLANPRLRSVLIEINEMLARDRDIVQTLEGHGFSVATIGEPVEDQAGTMKMRNYVFERKRV
jgi:FkbM family methyltransferase